jgi:uncharacterized protein (TIGR03086 family)
MVEFDLLESVLGKTAGVIEGVTPEQRRLPTPCPDYDVAALVDHLVGWIQVFDAGCHGRRYEGDANAYRSGPDPAGEFRASAASLVAGWRELGTDRQVTVTGGDGVPGAMVLNMTLMEYMTHGWDLAAATGQTVPYTEAEAAETLARAQATLPPQYRGEGMPFAHEVPVDGDAAAVDRLIGFMGRDPSRPSPSR